MKRAAVLGIFLLTLVVLIVAAACAAPKPTPTATPRPTVAPTATTVPPTPTPAVGPTPTQRPTTAPTTGPTATATPTTTAPGKVYEWTFTMVGAPPPASLQPFTLEAWKELERRSEGRIKINVMFDGQHPFKNPDLLDAINRRLIDGAYQTPDYFTSLEPLPGAINQPFLVSGDPAEYWWIWDQVREEALVEPLARWNQMSLYEYIMPNVTGFQARAFVRNRDEASKLKIRAYGKAQADQIEAFSANTLVVSWGDVSTSLERGIIDGLAISTASVYRAKLFEYIKYVTRVPGWSHQPQNVTLSLAAFNELPPDLQQVVRDFSSWAWEFASNSAAEDDATFTMKSIFDYGVSIGITPSAYLAEVRPKMEKLWEEWANSSGPQAPGILQKMKTLHDQWVAAHK